MRGLAAFHGFLGPGTLLALVLAGCASAPPGPHSQMAAGADVRPPSRGEDGLDSFERRQRALAETAAQQRRWADAVWAWDVVLALNPGDATAKERRAKAQLQADEVAADRKVRAQQAAQRGDVDAAMRLYLEALAQAPGDRASADALRELERQRTRRGNVLGYRSPGLNLARRPNDGGWMLLPQATATNGRNELEHASLLASQGELDAAIAMLQPLASARRADPAVRGRLADLYWRKAEQMASQDPKAAIQALELCLQWAPNHAQAKARLKALRAAPEPVPARSRR